ncbi:MAG: DUF2270 domain-containing protein [Anaerolineae bacterium]|jgi:uncharacterized membrane protein|nr:DUF2270 domain-containing protein [Anaerolineae bacterium]
MPNQDGETGRTWNYEGYCLEPNNFVTAFVHLYRAEVTRVNLWRNRLDTTTNWAVVTTGAALTFSFSSPSNPHFVMLLVLLLILTFMLIEARRYSYYALWHYRAQLLETDFFAAMVAPPYSPAEGWGEALGHALRNPTFITPRWRAAAVRYRRNYVWLVSLVLLSWFLKLSIHPVQAISLREVVDRAAVAAWVSGPWVVGIVAGVYVGLLLLIALMYLIPEHFDGDPKAYKGRVRGITAEEAQMAIVITNQKEQVAARLMQELKRGVTALAGTGMYTGERHDVLLCASTAAQEHQLRTIVEQVDPRAFVIMTGARDIHGRGFAPSEPPT